ncbi:MAG: STAS/SEC14 domain-containing protein [Burkholderiaceae bacterium]
MALSVEFESTELVVLRPSGELKRVEVDTGKRKVYRHIMEHGKVQVLVLIEPGFTQLQAFASWEDIPEDKLIQQSVTRLALVGDLRWRDQAVLFFITAVASFPIEFFPADQEFFARTWLAT